MKKTIIKLASDSIVSLDFMARAPKAQEKTNPTKVFAWSLCLALTILLTLSILIQYSAGSHIHPNHWLQHLIRIFIAGVAAVLIAYLPKNFLRNISGYLYALGICLLILVHFKGLTIKGATRWLALGPLRLEPSEFVKILTPLYLAHFLSFMRMPISLRHFILCQAIILVPFFLIAKQPDLGTALIVLCIGLTQIYVSGLSYQVIGILFSLLLASMPAIWSLLHDYQKNRILTLIYSDSDTLGTGYHIAQSKIAIGSGGLFGKGLFSSTQVAYGFLPEFHTDFIFALICEEMGMFGALILLILLLTISISILCLALHATSAYSRLLLSAIAFYFFICTFINTGMVSGMLPVVGIPLPFLSYGGSNLLVCGVALGIVWSQIRESSH